MDATQAVKTGDWVLVPAQPITAMIIDAVVAYENCRGNGEPSQQRLIESMRRAYEALLGRAPIPDEE